MTAGTVEAAGDEPEIRPATNVGLAPAGTVEEAER